MSWLLRQAVGRSESEVQREHARYLRAAGVDRALEAMAGPYGLRRFMVAFQAVPAGAGRLRVELVELLAMPLSLGGGPPPPDPDGRHRAALETALTRLQINMASGPAWSRGVLGYVRDGRGRSEILPAFDEDADVASLDALPVPSGPGHPLEQPAYAHLLATWEPRMRALQERSARLALAFDGWEVHDDRLRLELAEGRALEFPCQPLLSFAPARGRLSWQTARRPGGERPFDAPEVLVDWSGAHELALLAGACLDAAWLFNGEFGEQGELLYAAVFRLP